SKFSREKWIVLLLFANARHRSVTGTNNRVLRKGENLFKVILHGVFVRNAAAAHRSGEHRVADDGDRPRQAGADKRDSAGGMSPRQSRLDSDLPQFEIFSFLDSFRPGDRFTRR